MTMIYAVVSKEIGTVLLHREWDLAEAAAGELNALDPEDFYYVQQEPLWDLEI